MIRIGKQRKLGQKKRMKVNPPQFQSQFAQKGCQNADELAFDDFCSEISSLAPTPLPRPSTLTAGKMFADKEKATRDDFSLAAQLKRRFERAKAEEIRKGDSIIVARKLFTRSVFGVIWIFAQVIEVQVSATSQ